MITVLSLFDGISCARVALDRLNIPCVYYSSEIDKYALKISEKNYPDIIRLGDVKNITGEGLPSIDLLIGGSPCQDLSGAGKAKGLSGERSGLFYEYLRLKDSLKPRYFLLENVASMKRIYRDSISKEMGVEPIEINSALVSAQSRKRLYWTNIPNVSQPGDREIYLKDIIESGIVDRDKSYCIDAHYYMGFTPATYYRHHRRQVVYLSDKLCVIGKDPRQNRVYSTDGKSVSLSSNGGGRGAKTGLDVDKDCVRKLTPLECERLQTLPDNYTAGVSNTQRYKMLGNAFTVEVIRHILSYADFS